MYCYYYQCFKSIWKVIHYIVTDKKLPKTSGSFLFIQKYFVHLPHRNKFHFIKEKIMYKILQREKKYSFEIRKLVLSILKIIRMATAIYIPVQVYLLRNIVFSLFLEKSLYKINKNINLLFSLLLSIFSIYSKYFSFIKLIGNP